MSDRELAAVMRAFISRPERVSIVEVGLPTGRIGYRVDLHGSVVVDKHHADAVEEGM